MRATFISRPNRFIAVVDIDGAKTDVHVANSGRLRELLTPGRMVYLEKAIAGARRTLYTLSLVEMPSALVSIDSRLSSSLAAEAFAKGTFPRFSAFNNLRREVTYHNSRLDLMLSSSDSTCYIETKCSTLVKDGVAMFPDAPTARGLRHLRDLIHACKAGHHASVMFVIQRDYAISFAPNWETDRDFCETLALASKSGVEVCAYTCNVTLEGIEIHHEVPVSLMESHENAPRHSESTSRQPAPPVPIPSRIYRGEISDK